MTQHLATGVGGVIGMHGGLPRKRFPSTSLNHTQPTMLATGDSASGDSALMPSSSWR
jgi:hypothetical protein